MLNETNKDFLKGKPVKRIVWLLLVHNANSE
jgi:hypothetical protein